jgi:hypothetical protein
MDLQFTATCSDAEFGFISIDNKSGRISSWNKILGLVFCLCRYMLCLIFDDMEDGFRNIKTQTLLPALPSVVSKQ